MEIKAIEDLCNVKYFPKDIGTKYRNRIEFIIFFEVSSIIFVTFLKWS